MLAPISAKQFAKSIISGSRAAFFIIVLPLANVEAIKIFSVAPTETNGKFISQPLSPLGAVAFTYPPFKSMVAPKASKAERCKSIGLVPIAQPPGIDTLASPHLAKSGPKTSTEALIFLTRS